MPIIFDHVQWKISQQPNWKHQFYRILYSFEVSMTDSISIFGAKYDKFGGH